MFETIFVYVIPGIMILGGIYLSFTSEILKDQCDCDDKPYSFARAQLMWWTLIILSCFSIHYGLTSNVPVLSSSCLVLLGISLGTTTAARMIDNTEINNRVDRHQNKNQRKGFLFNILSDNNGISMHRFQALIFNIIYGVVFVVEFLNDDAHGFIDFESTELGLMGISAAAYVGLKLNENNDKPPVSPPKPDGGAIAQATFKKKDDSGV